MPLLALPLTTPTLHRLARSSLPPCSRPELGNSLKTFSTTIPRYSLMRHLVLNAWHIRALRRTTSSGTRDHQYASRCSCMIPSRTRSATPTMDIYHDRQPFLRLQGTPSTFALSMTRLSLRLQGGIRHMVWIRRDQADGFGMHPQNCSRYVLLLTSHLCVIDSRA